MHRISFLAGVLFVAATSACTTLTPTPAGAEVSRVTAAEATSCRRLGRVVGTTDPTVFGMARSLRRIRSEVETQARNRAAVLGADAILPLDALHHGRQPFLALRCDRAP